MSYEKPQPLELDTLREQESHYARALDVMNTTVEANGSNLFTVPLKKAHSLDGIDRSIAIMDIGLQREMVCDLYGVSRIPQAEELLDITRSEIVKKAMGRAETLKELLENGYLSLDDYRSAISPLREFLPDEYELVKLPSGEQNGEQSLREEILRRASQLRMKGPKKRMFDELLNALTPETEYPNQALQLAVYPQPGPDGHRPKLAGVVNSLRKDLLSVGIDLVSNKAASRSSYRLGLFDEDEIIGKASEGSMSGKILEKIANADLAKKQQAIVGELVGCYSPLEARSKKEWIIGAYPGVSDEIAESRLTSFLPHIRKKLEAQGVFIHMYRIGHETFYYLSDREEAEEPPVELLVGKARRVSRVKKLPEGEVTDNERDRREIEDRVRLITGSLHQGLVDED